MSESKRIFDSRPRHNLTHTLLDHVHNDVPVVAPPTATPTNCSCTMDLPCALVSWRVLYSLWILSSLLLVGPTRSLLPNPLIDAAEKANSLKKLDECFCQVSIIIIYLFLIIFILSSLGRLMCVAVTLKRSIN